jgi:hypothetical protein
MMTPKLFTIIAMLTVVPILTCAAGSEEGTPGRYQIITREDMFGHTLFMIDSSNGHTWRLTTVREPMSDGSPGTIERWLPLEMGDRPLPPQPVPTHNKP